MTRYVSLLTMLTICVMLGAAPASSADPTVGTAPGCAMQGDLIVGHGLGAPPPSFIKVSSKDGKLTEILPLPKVESDLIQTQSLFTGLAGPDKWTKVSCVGVNAVDDDDNVSLFGQPCDYKNTAVIDNGPRILFAGAGRNESDAVIRVQVTEEKFFASGVETLDDWVGFTVDGAPEVALPARGVEPVYVTARFPNLPPGPHHIGLTVFDGFNDHDAPGGVVCL